MQFIEQQPLSQLSLEWRTQTVVLEELAPFVQTLQQLLAALNEKESEEHNKNLVRDFLKAAFAADYADTNTKGRVDLAVYQDGLPVVLIEAKAPGKSADFPTPNDLNTKALQELVRYYMAERLAHHNNRITHLIITNGLEWFILKAQDVERHFYEHTAFRKAYQSWAKGELTSQKTDHFYKEIARPHIAQLEAELPFLYLNLKELGKLPENLVQLRNQSRWLQAFRVLHPYHLLKKPLPNRGNTLNRPFYEELLHLLGLHEEGTKNPKPITRLPQKERQSGSFIENTIQRMLDKDVLNLNADIAKDYGNTHDEQLFGMAFELVSAWLNRILFLKLLEGQLVSYHLNERGEAGDLRRAFLHISKIPELTTLNRVFFQVLAKRQTERDDSLIERFGYIPYLNSSLFDRTRLEKALRIEIDTLDESAALVPFSHTVLRKDRDKSSKLLPYLFQFLDAYDFSTVEVREVRDGNRGLIDARVLGLVFEKLNGYKDGSFYTPSFVTMFMAKEAVERAIVNKLNSDYGFTCETYAQVVAKVERLSLPERKKVSALVRSLKILDPAVGSGHFLVSVLNQLVYCLWELELLFYHDSEKLVLPTRYSFSIVDDELVIIDQNGERLHYVIGKTGEPNAEVQALQVTLFHLKQALIENCLFGVDLNPASVYICRLRLWIELLKHAYYGAPDFQHMETLPNLDINIKRGNSLVNKFRLDYDISGLLTKHNWSLNTYLDAVVSYKSATDASVKRELLSLIDRLKHDLKDGINQTDEVYSKLAQKRADFEKLYRYQSLLRTENETETSAKDQKRKEKLLSDIAVLEEMWNRRKSGEDHKGAFEWRFEFPEVLNLDNSAFVGFDIVIGNPPYIRQEQIKHLKRVLQDSFKQTYSGTADIFVFFFELGYHLLRNGGTLAYITSSKFMRAGYGEKLRGFLKDKTTIRTLVDFGDLPVFDEAIAYPLIYVGEKVAPQSHSTIAALTVVDKAKMKSFEEAYSASPLHIPQHLLEPDAWRLANPQVSTLLHKMRKAGKPLGQYVDGKIFYGIKTGLNEAFVIDTATKDRLIAEDPRSAEVLKPFLRGRDIKRYEKPKVEQWLILFPKGVTIKSNKNSSGAGVSVVNEPPPRYGDMPYMEARTWLEENYPAIYNWLKPYEAAAKLRTDKGDFWWELRACDYYEEFEKPKIIVPTIVDHSSLTFSTETVFSNDKTTIITGQDLYFLCSVANSKAVEYFMKAVSPSKQNNYFEYKPAYITQIPIPKATKQQQQALEQMAKAVMAAKAKGEATQALEAKIDDIVCQLYGLGAEERALVLQA